MRRLVRSSSENFWLSGTNRQAQDTSIIRPVVQSTSETDSCRETFPKMFLGAQFCIQPASAPGLDRDRLRLPIRVVFGSVGETELHELPVGPLPLDVGMGSHYDVVSWTSEKSAFRDILF
jgi:hypothetical protein